jgi:novel protein kinase C delta type
VQLVQKKKTIYPEWNSCFDAHLYEGRVIQMVVNHRPATKIAECNVTARSLADKCNNGELTSIWVSRSARPCNLSCCDLCMQRKVTRGTDSS